MEPIDQVKITEDLLSTQLRLEEEMTSRGADRYIRGVSKAIEKNAEDSTDYGQQIMAGRLERVAQGIAQWMAESAEGNPSRWGTAYKLVKEAPTTTLAFLALKHVMAGISSVRTLQDVAVGIGMAVEDELRFAKVRAEEAKVFERLVEGAAKRTSPRFKHVYAARIADNTIEWERWSRTDRLHVGIKLLDIVMLTAGLVEVVANSGHSTQALKYVRALPETLKWIEKKNDVTALLRPVYEPMVVPPREWTTPFDGGYLSSNIKPLKLVKTKNRAYLEDLSYVDMPIVYTAINAIQNTAWQINGEVLAVMRTLWDGGTTVAGLPPRDGLPMPVKPYDIDTNEESKKAYRIEAARTYHRNLSILGKRVGFNMILGVAERYKDFERIYFPYQLDFRGRIYAVPHLNPQGADHTKALLRFAEGKPLGENGWKWLAIHGANLAGNDKVSLEDRVNWILDNEDEILAIAADPYTNRGWATAIDGVDIDSPWQFLGFCFEWAGYVREGDEFVSHIPVAMDGSCSGIQHFSAMLRDERGGAAVNLVPNPLPADVYRLVAERVIVVAEHDAVHGTEDALKHTEDGKAYVQPGTKTLARQWLQFGITRKVTKRSVMTLAYGSKQYGFKEQLMEDIIGPAKASATSPDGTLDTEKFPFEGDGFRAANYMATAIWAAVNEVLVKAGEAMRWLQDAASLAAAEGLPVRWTTPVGFPVMQAYPALEQRRVKTAINGKLIYLVMNKERDELDKRKQGQGISPNFVHSCDAAHLMLTVVRASQKGITNFSVIHDSFGTNAGDTEELFSTVREAFVEMYNEIPVLENFRDEIARQLSEKALKKLKPLPERGTLELDRVCESRYCFA
ncbi:RNA polymerase [Ralstonia phage BOESR1]|uniref:DNA-directed RNA polymerase n=1 Tax=Ralstonia phage BOESR1 TaxID=3034917 RepID=A0AA50F3G4_9CAUD|nr:RNA polymerase [Ralstonia phage BOESR1]WLW40583.1 RNA polymerase [Ralstonia phage BOESR1]